MITALLWPALGHAVPGGWPPSPPMYYKSLLDVAGISPCAAQASSLPKGRDNVAGSGQRRALMTKLQIS